VHKGWEGTLALLIASAYIGVVTTQELAMRPMLVAMILPFAINAAPAFAQTGFASCFILFRPTEARSIAYLTGSFASSSDEASDQHRYLDPFVRFLASKYPPNGSGTVQAACNFSTSASDVEQMSEYVVGPADLNANSVVHTDWKP